MKKISVFYALLIILLTTPLWGASQDFKGTIDGNTITAGTGTVTISGSNTLTVDETSAMSSKAPKASPVFTGIITAPIVQSIKGETATIATATPITIFTPVSQGVYWVTTWINGGGSTEIATALVVYDGYQIGLLNYSHGVNMTLSISGTDVQVTQNEGASDAIQYLILRLN